MPNSTRKSIDELLSEGWIRDTGVAHVASYPQFSHVIMRKGEKFLRHSFNVYKDSSDFPESDAKVLWDEVEVYEETIRRCRPVR